MHVPDEDHKYAKHESASKHVYIMTDYETYQLEKKRKLVSSPDAACLQGLPREEA
jgi:hypothetical protein